MRAHREEVGVCADGPASAPPSGAAAVEAVELMARAVKEKLTRRSNGGHQAKRRKEEKA
jgi:hypothetical protein